MAHCLSYVNSVKCNDWPERGCVIQHKKKILFALDSKAHAYNASQKHESTLLHKYVLNEFLTADRSFITKYFRKTLIKVGSSHLCASFDTFSVQIGLLFETQRVFEKCLKTVKSLFSKENIVDFRILTNV